jgi:hypothetical protein
MIVADEHGAKAWLKAWGSRAFALGRAERLAKEQRGLAAFCGDRMPARRDGHIRAAECLEAAIKGGS